MIKVLILYYLSLKSTHGYEIQKFIQVNHMDSWTKIQSGSIYYALAKLEKEGLITLSHKAGTGAKARKIYSITETGRQELKRLVNTELKTPICQVGSDKFIIYPLLTVSEKSRTQKVIASHINELKKKKEDMEVWRQLKVNEQTLEVEKLSFEMMLVNYDYQIRWHEALLSQLDRCMAESERIAQLIMAYDFTDAELADSEGVVDLEGLKSKIMKTQK